MASNQDDDGWARWFALRAVAEMQREEEAKEEERTLGFKILTRNLRLFTSFVEERPPETLPEPFLAKIRALGGSDSSVTLVLKKVLTKSDVDFRQCRFMIPFKQVKDHAFLSKEEKGFLDSGGKIRDILMIDPGCDVEVMDLTRWKVSAGRRSYLLVRNWTKVVRRNRLKVEDSVQLWGFWRGFVLGFALVRTFNSSSSSSSS